MMHPPPITRQLFVSLLMGFMQLQAADPGRIHLQNGDVLAGDLLSVNTESLSLRIPSRDAPLKIPAGWPEQWQSTAERPPVNIPETCDALTLRSGQVLWGTVKSLDAEVLHFKSLWGQSLHLPRESVASLVPNTPTHNGRLDPAAWKFRVNRGEPAPLSEGWTPAAGTLFHSRPLGHTLFHRTQQNFRTCRLVFEVEYPDRRKFCVLRVHSDTEEENNRWSTTGLSIRSKSLTWRDKNHWQGGWVIPLPPEPARGPEPETLRVEAVYDVKNEQARVYINGQLSDTRSLFIEDPKAFQFTGARLQLQMLGNQPIRIRRLALLEGTGTTSAAGLEHDPALLLGNGDRMEAEILSYDGETYTIQLGETSLPLPADRVMGVGLHTVQSDSTSPGLHITLHSPHPVLKAHSLELDDEHLRLRIEGVEDVLILPRHEAAMIAWPRHLLAEDAATSFRADLSDARTVTGHLQSLDPESTRILPLWSPEPLTLPTAELQEMTRLEDPAARILHPLVILHNGDVLRGSAIRLEKGILEIKSPGGEPHAVRLADIRTLLNPGDKDASWIVDPVQLMHPNLPGDPDQLPKLTGEGVTYARGLRIRHSLPVGSPGYHLKARFSNARNVSIHLRLDSVIRNGKRMGVMIAVAGTGLNVMIGPGGKHEKFKIPTSPGADRSIEVYLDKEKKRLRVRIDGNPICDMTHPDWTFAEDAGDLYMTGFTLGCTVEEFQLVSWDGTDVPEGQNDGEASLWVEGAYQGRGRLVPLGQNAPGFRIEEQNRPLPLDSTTGYAIRFPAPPLQNVGPDNPSVTLFLRDGVSRIQGFNPRLNGETVEITSSPFPSGLQLPAEDVQRIEFSDKMIFLTE